MARTARSNYRFQEGRERAAASEPGERSGALGPPRAPAFAKAPARSRRSASRGGGSQSGSPRGEAPRKKRVPPRFITTRNAQIELAPWGKHWWLSRPGFTDTKQLTLVRVTMRPGTGHRFHYHPAREEIIYVIDGVAEQWVDREKRTLEAGECAFIRERVVHAIHNVSKKPMTFLAILSPAEAEGPFLIDCYDDEPWRSLRKPTPRQPAKRSPAPRKRVRSRRPSR